MMTISDVLIDNSHRPWPLPTGSWVWYQEWNRVLFLHWSVPLEVIRPLVPASLDIDTHEGQAWVSLVPFTMNRIRPRGLPAVSAVSDFDEVNLRTYVTDGRKPGVFFLSIQAQKALASWLARTISGLPYRTAEIARTADAYRVRDEGAGLHLDARFSVGSGMSGEKTALDLWLTERYCLYAVQPGRILRYEIHHQPWPLNEVRLDSLTHDYRVGTLSLGDRSPDLVHYSPGVRVLAWGSEVVSGD